MNESWGSDNWVEKNIYSTDMECNCPNFDGKYGTPHKLSECNQFGFNRKKCGCYFNKKGDLIINPSCETKYAPTGRRSTSFLDDHWLFPQPPTSMCGCEKFGKLAPMHLYKKGECPNFGLQEQIELKNFMDKIIEVAKRDSDKRTSSIVFLKLLEEIGEYTAAKVGDKKADEKPHEELVDTIIAAICLYSLEGGSIEHLIEYGRYKLRKYDKKMGF